MISIDGSFGEGGGQILRTSLALSLVTGSPFRMIRIRAARKKPGLQRQHLTAVRAAAEVGAAEVEGATLGSQQLVFAPGKVRGGDYRFDVGTAGSVTLVVQTILPALVLAPESSNLDFVGGTHNVHAPPFDFLAKAFLPLIRRMGPQVEATLDRPGFYPAGGGSMRVSIRPAESLGSLELMERGEIVRRLAWAMVSRLPLHIAQREVDTVRKRLGWPEKWTEAREVESQGPGNAVIVEIESRHVTEVFVGFGQRGVPAETVATGAAREAERYLESGVPVDEHLADQLLLPLALAGRGAFRTLPLTSHTTTNMATIQKFLDVEIRAEEVAEEVWEVRVEGRAK